jgi:hypothetical protein
VEWAWRLHKVLYPRIGGLIKAENTRRFPAPWSAEVQPNYYVVRDANKQQLAYVYYEAGAEFGGEIIDPR